MMESFGVPTFILNLLSEDQLMTVANLLLDLNWQIALPHIPLRFLEEIRGIADGSGIDEQKVRRINMLPELTQAHCTVLGVWD